MQHSNNTILKSLNDLIEYSTDFRFQRSASFQQLHIALIKHFFNASSVVLDIDTNSVCLGIDVLKKGAEVTIAFDNLEKFLKSCIRNKPTNMAFYKNILHYYASNAAVA
ncbi:hypothetical protein [Dokdonia sp. R78006]|uniref:hypothetical protein n=1 Tax=Dokdonia sp. R78006 TaxID=3093866 RepID=UPI0036D3D4B7